MRGRRPKPTKLKQLTGNPGKRPLRHVRGLVSAPLEDKAPVWLGKDARQEFIRVRSELHRAGLLSRLDSVLVLAWCSAFGDFVCACRVLLRSGAVRRDRDGNLRRNPWLLVKARAVQELQRIATEFGMTPSARARLGEPMARAPVTHDYDDDEREPRRPTLDQFIARTAPKKPTLSEFIAQGRRPAKPSLQILPKVVMRGLDPRIQGRRPRGYLRGRRLDARLEAGHDERAEQTRGQEPTGPVKVQSRTNETEEPPCPTSLSWTSPISVISNS